MVKSMVLKELHTLEETTMDKVRFLMSDTGAQITEACREALEQKGVEVTVVEKDGNKVLQKMLAVRPQVVLLDQPLSLTLKNSINCMIAFLPHALAASIVQILFWGVVILCMPLGLFLMLIFGFWFVTEVSCQIVYGDIDRVFHIEENIRKMKDAELEAALKEDYADDDTPEE